MATFSFTPVIKAVVHARSGAISLWKKFRALKLWQQGAIVAAVLAVIVGTVVLLQPKAAATDTQHQTVTLASVGSLSGTAGSVSVVGTIRSISEASVLAQAGGTVQAIHASVGQKIPAGYIIAELDNATERASVLQAEGLYDAAVAGRSAVSPSDSDATVRNAYRSAYTSLDTTLSTQVDTFYGAQGAFGPTYLISPGPISGIDLAKHRQQLIDRMNTWRTNLASADTANPGTLLDEADGNVQLASALLTDIARSANANNSGATAAQLSALAAARASVNGLAATISGAREAYRGKSVTSTAGADASVKQALGTLRLAQANLEKKIVRAPIAGTLNFMPLHIGDYVTAFMHAATVAQNGALEAVTYVSEDDRSHFATGDHVTIEGGAHGIVTSIAPALDPTTHQIEVHVAIDTTSTSSQALVNGQSVRIGFATGTAPKTPAPAASGPLLLPLTALKLTSSARIVFSVGTDSRLVAHPVDIGEVRGDRIEVTTTLPSDLMIVTDARGLSEGEAVTISTTTL